ncbi:tellurium resistance protein TerD [Geodermatophilus amargosae]|uniref:Tellurium resistance protein TerD n=1 Tax=Geodermatophilus amargosae TaxID=1296565 RepID=A0A1I6ZWZ7_9ACTN|nr:TerD family protein [Geodermatophilus amargosae]SFT67218.1 tellurium resistance protein TerD [Geodermatophilus amargosae]
MTVVLAKGGNVSLSKEAPGLKAINVGLGWDVNTFSNFEYDLDASAIMLDASGKVTPDDSGFVFYNNLRSPDGSVLHTGDNLTGEGDGDDEMIQVDLTAVPQFVQKIVFPVSIHDADNRRQNFGGVRNAFIRVVDQVTDREITRYDLTEDASMETAMVFGELYRHNGDWKFRAVGQGYASGLRGIAQDFGVNVA